MLGKSPIGHNREKRSPWVDVGKGMWRERISRPDSGYWTWGKRTRRVIGLYIFQSYALLCLKSAVRVLVQSKSPQIGY